MSRTLTTLFVAAASLAAQSASAAKVTFNKHIAPLVWQQCANCHRPGQVAPFSLLSYRDVQKRAEQIRDITAEGLMPPWSPAPGHVAFSNGRRLTSEEQKLIAAWVAGGAVEGAASDLPPLPKFPEGWQLGKPDLVLEVPQPINVPATGRDLYVNVILPLKVPTGKYLKAIEFHPGNRRVVHHAVLFNDTSGKSRELDEADPKMGFERVTPPGKFLPGTMAIWTPGRNPLPLPEGLSMPWPEGSDLVLNLHLHPSGKPEQEQSSVGVYFTDEAPRRSMIDLTLIDTKIDIPPGEKAFPTTDSITLPIDMDAQMIFPHMHLIGKQMRVSAKLPDGSVKVLLRIDDWNFNWQDLYQYAEPIRLPKGTVVEMRGVHDNSAENPHNPRNPPGRVTWGEQTNNEMSIAFLNLTPVNESDMATNLPGQGIRGLKAAIMPASTRATIAAAAGKPSAGDIDQRAKDALKKFDRDANGKLNIDEIMVAINNRESREAIEKRLKDFDLDKDNELNPAELLEAIKSQAKMRAN
jgi:mono/diheme cytochrome c family protein